MTSQELIKHLESDWVDRLADGVPRAEVRRLFLPVIEHLRAAEEFINEIVYIDFVTSMRVDSEDVVDQAFALGVRHSNEFWKDSLKDALSNYHKAIE